MANTKGGDEDQEMGSDDDKDMDGDEDEVDTGHEDMADAENEDTADGDSCQMLQETIWHWGRLFSQHTNLRVIRAGVRHFSQCSQLQ